MAIRRTSLKEDKNTAKKIPLLQGGIFFTNYSTPAI